MAGSLTTQICIIGAGPAGSYAAWHLARAGCEVLVCEEHASIGTPVDCSGLVGVEAFDRLGLPRGSIRDTFEAFDLVAPSGARISFKPGRPLAFLVDRAQFDQDLAGQARAAGAEILTQASVRSVSPRDRDILLHVRHRGAWKEIQARAVVLASGPRYAIQQALGMGIPSKCLKTVQAEVAVASGGRPSIFFGSRIAPGSFAWYLPVRTRTGAYRVKIGVTAVEGSRAAFTTFVRLLRERQHLANEPILPRSWMIPISPLRRTFARRVVAVGDAAAQTKPTTGGGLYYGLLCAAQAADVLTDACRRDDFSEARLASYEARWRGLLGRELATGLRFRERFERLSDVELNLWFECLREDGFLRTLEEEATFDWHRRTILRAARWVPWARALARGVARTRMAELLS